MIREGHRESAEELLTRDLYRRVFLSPEGRKVLAMILADLGAFEPVSPGDEHSQALRNYGTMLLENIGVFHEANLEQITSALLSVKVYFPPESEDKGG